MGFEQLNFQKELKLLQRDGWIQEEWGTLINEGQKRIKTDKMLQKLIAGLMVNTVPVTTAFLLNEY